MSRMKEKLKYIVAVLTAGTLAVWFLPFISIGGVRLSFLGILKVGLGFYGGTEVEELVLSAVRTYLETYIWWIAVGVLLLLLEVFLTAILRKRLPYIIGMIGSIIDGIGLAVLVVLLYIRLQEVETVISPLGEDIKLELQIPVLLIIAACYLAIFLLCLIGILLWKKPEKEENDLREDTFTGQQTMETPFQDTQWQESEEELIERRLAQERAAFVQTQREKFTGALIPEGGDGSSYTYPLEEGTEVFFCMDGTYAEVSSLKQDNAVAAVCFLQDEGVYVVEPFERACVYLESGQPLGKDRHYRLARGTKIYIREKKNQFILS